MTVQRSSNFYDYARDFVAFCDTFLPRTEMGKPWSMVEHHRRFYRQTFVFDAQGVFLPRWVVHSEPKKHSKTMLDEGCIPIWWTVCHGGQVDLYANDLDQSEGLGFGTVVGLLNANGFVKAKLCKVRNTWVEFNNGGVIQARPRDFKGAAGGRQALSVFGELCHFTDERGRKLWEECTPPPSTPNAWLLVSTTAGVLGEAQLLHELYERGRAGEVIDSDLPLYRNGRFYMMWSHRCRMPWHTEEFLAEQRSILRRATYRRLWQNDWVETESALLTEGQVDACVYAALTPVLRDEGLEITVGCDIGLVDDWAAVYAVAWTHGRIRVVCGKVWKSTREHPLNLTEVERYLLDLDQRFCLLRVLYDPFQFVGTATRLEAAGLPMQAFTQTEANVNRMGSTLYDLVKQRQLICYPDDDLRTCLLNVSARENVRTGGFKMSKTSKTRKIDAAVALSMALVGTLDAGPELPPLMLASATPVPGSAFDEWLRTRGSWPTSDEEPDGDGEVIDLTDAEYEALPAEEKAQLVPVNEPPRLTRAERRRQHHANVESIAKRDGIWMPGDDL